jgi:hypothetical protein
LFGKVFSLPVFLLFLFFHKFAFFSSFSAVAYLLADGFDFGVTLSRCKDDSSCVDIGVYGAMQRRAQVLYLQSSTNRAHRRVIVKLCSRAPFEAMRLLLAVVLHLQIIEKCIDVSVDGIAHQFKGYTVSDSRLSGASLFRLLSPSLLSPSLGLVVLEAVLILKFTAPISNDKHSHLRNLFRTKEILLSLGKWRDLPLSAG